MSEHGITWLDLSEYNLFCLLAFEKNKQNNNNNKRNEMKFNWIICFNFLEEKNPQKKLKNCKIRNEMKRNELRFMFNAVVHINPCPSIKENII